MNFRKSGGLTNKQLLNGAPRRHIAPTVVLKVDTCALNGAQKELESTGWVRSEPLTLDPACTSTLDKFQTLSKDDADPMAVIHIEHNKAMNGQSHFSQREATNVPPAKTIEGVILTCTGGSRPASLCCILIHLRTVLELTAA